MHNGPIHPDERDDQFRQNELVIAGTIELRFSSVVVRAEPGLVAGQLRRALWR